MLNKKILQYIFTRGTCKKKYANIFLKSHLSNVNLKKKYYSSFFTSCRNYFFVIHGLLEKIKLEWLTKLYI